LSAPEHTVSVELVGFNGELQRALDELPEKSLRGAIRVTHDGVEIVRFLHAHYVHVRTGGPDQVAQVLDVRSQDFVTVCREESDCAVDHGLCVLRHPKLSGRLPNLTSLSL
jgi:hypothetical protein